jgi:hypothetical protein
MVLRQQVSVNSLEGINRRVGQQAGQFLDQLPTPPAAQEGELLVFTGDCKGVPLVHEEAQQVPVFQEELERPGNRRMARLNHDLGGLHSHARTARCDSAYAVGLSDWFLIAKVRVAVVTCSIMSKFRLAGIERGRPPEAEQLF